MDAYSVLKEFPGRSCSESEWNNWLFKRDKVLAVPAADACLEIERLQRLLVDAQSGLLRALDFRTATPEGISIKDYVRDALRRTGYTGNFGERATV